MRSLRERLAELQPSVSRAAPPHVTGAPIEEVEAGRLVTSPLGSIFVSEYPRDDPDLGHFQPSPTAIPPCFLPRAPLVQPEEIVFLDTETTGLAGGTGTYAFLVGLGLFEDGHFRLRQLFMRGPVEEPALLDTLQQTLARCKLLVTFNGRSFDWPLLETRFILHGFRPSFDFEHLDILHPARRVWKHRLRDCSLGNLEAALLGLRRDLDVPGFLIPQLYFDYLRDGDARRLRAVFAHNREDIVTMARLTARLLQAAAEPRSVLSHPADRARRTGGWNGTAGRVDRRGRLSVRPTAACRGGTRSLAQASRSDAGGRAPAIGNVRPGGTEASARSLPLRGASQILRA